jgi:hypothetical protein
MKPLLLAITFTLTAAPALADPVDLECEGTMWLMGTKANSWHVSGIRVIIVEDAGTVVVAGEPLFSATYTIDLSKGDAARLEFFFADRWQGAINRYNGELQLLRCAKADCKSFDNVVQATCAKADPLF